MGGLGWVSSFFFEGGIECLKNLHTVLDKEIERLWIAKNQAFGVVFPLLFGALA